MAVDANRLTRPSTRLGTTAVPLRPGRALAALSPRQIRARFAFTARTRKVGGEHPGSF